MPQLAGKEVGSTGYGLMGLTWRPKPCPTEQAFDAMKTAYTTGANFWNGGEFYGTAERNSLHLVNEYFTKYPEEADKIVLSIKGGVKPGQMVPDGSEENVRRSVDLCLRLLDGKKKLDLFECARVDPKTPIEVTIRTLASYVKEGKLGGISLSECSAESIRRAAKIHKIDAVEVEFSLFATDILDNGVAKACADLGITVVAYSPLGRGFLTGDIKKLSDLPEDDMRRHFPRFSEQNFETNMKLVYEVEKVAKRKNVPTGNIAIAWVKALSGKNGLPTMIPIPGATTAARVTENNNDVTLDEQDLEDLSQALKKCVIVGNRYYGAANHLNFGDSPEEK